MVQSGIQNKLSPRVVWYRLITGVVLIACIYLITRFVSGAATIPANINGVPGTVSVSSWGPFITLGVPFILACLLVVYNILYYKIFSFVFDSDKISVTSGVIFQSTKTIDFKTLQSISTKSGPLLMIFGLKLLQGFTASPGQLVITSNRNDSSNTTYRPDISIPLISADAEQLRDLMAQSAEVDKVKVVQ